MLEIEHHSQAPNASIYNIQITYYNYFLLILGHEREKVLSLTSFRIQIVPAVASVRNVQKTTASALIGKRCAENFVDVSVSFFFRSQSISFFVSHKSLKIF